MVRALLAGEQAGLLAPLAMQDPCLESPLPQVPGRSPSFDRTRLSQSLRSFNAEVQNPNTETQCNLLGNPETEVVVTGQQAGLFGGPIYALSKAIAATLWAKRLTESGRPAVAVFWIASEDHDFEEVRSACLGAHTLSAEIQETSTRPVGQRLIDEGLLKEIGETIAQCGSAITTPPFLEQALELARSCYVQGQPFSSGFARLLPALLGEHCPLLLDSQDPVLKAMQAQWARRLVRRSVASIAALELRERDIETAGFKLQIGSARQADGGYVLPLFLHREGCRYRVVLDAPDPAAAPFGQTASSSYSLRGYDEQGSMEELVALIEAQPSWMSPSAVLRPVLQDAALGTTLQVLGPGEVAYVPQAAALYDVLEVAPPTIALRPQAVFVPERMHRQYLEMIETAGFTAAELFGKWEGLEKLLAERSDNGTLEGIAQLRVATLEQLTLLQGKAVELDASLEAALQKTHQHLAKGFDNFHARSERAAAQKAGVLSTRIKKLRELALPQGSLQERRLCSLWVAAQFGNAAVPQIAEQLSLDPRRLQVLPLAAERP